MSNYKHFKHYYDPYDSLDVEWQNVVSKGHLTISEVVSLSGYTKSYVYRLVKDGIIPCMNGKSGKQESSVSGCCAEHYTYQARQWGSLIQCS